MKRVFPTQLRVVDDRGQLNTEEESKKGYYDVTTKNSIRIGVNGLQAIYLSSPGNWYRSCIFTIINLPKVSGLYVADAQDIAENGGLVHDVDEISVCAEPRPSDDPYDLWRIVASVVKTECGRKVTFQQGKKYVTVEGINKDMAKQFYYLLKHSLSKIGAEFKVSYSLLSPFSADTAPDVREKPRRKRHQQNRPKGELIKTTTTTKVVVKDKNDDNARDALDVKRWADLF